MDQSHSIEETQSVETSVTAEIEAAVEAVVDTTSELSAEVGATAEAIVETTDEPLLMEEIHEEEHAEGGMPQLDPTSFSSQLFWLVVVFAFLYVFMAKAIVPRIRNVLGKRQHQIRHDLDAAEELKRVDVGARQTNKKELQTAKNKAMVLLQKTQKDIDQSIAEEQHKLNETLEKMLSTSEAKLETKRAEGKQAIKPMLESLTAQITESILGEKPEDDKVKATIAKLEGAA